MNEKEVLIYHYSAKNQKWYDATNSVLWYNYDGRAWKVLFANSNQYFHVSFSNMIVYHNPRKIDFLELYYKESPCYKVKELLCFDNKI